MCNINYRSGISKPMTVDELIRFRRNVEALSWPCGIRVVTAGWPFSRSFYDE
jgi:hypothetical protein